MAPSPSSRLYEMGDRLRQREIEDSQTPKDKMRVLIAFLADERNNLRDTLHNREIFCKSLGNDFFSFDALRKVAQENRNRMEHRPTPNVPLKRQVSVDEVFSLYAQVQKANASWMADTVENKRKVCELFTSDDPRISHELSLKDMVEAARILSATLDRVPPPAKPKFEDSLESWQLPMPSPDYILRKSTKEQLADYIERAKRYEVWLKEQE